MPVDDIHTLVKIVIAIGSVVCIVVAAVVEARMKLSWLRGDVDRHDKEQKEARKRHEDCSKEQTDRYNALVQAIHDFKTNSTSDLHDLKNDTSRVAQKLEDFIEWSKQNHG